MDFGYFTLTDNPPAYGDRRRDPSAFFHEVIEEAVFADEIGLHSVWLPEHHFGLFGCLGATSTALGYLAARTKRVQLAPATVLLPCNHPVLVAEQYCTLDQLSGGRALFSAGRGYDHREYEAFGVPFAESRERFDEGMLLVRKAMAEENITWDGQIYQVPEPITILPRPVQKPHPPIYVAAFSRPTVEMAARNGFNVLFAPFAAAMMFGSLANAANEFKQIAEASGYPDSRVLCSYFFGLADDAEEERRFKDRVLMYLKSITPAFPGDPSTAPPHIAYFVDIVRRILAMRPEDLGERSIVTGDAARCVAQLKQVEAAGISEVILYFNVGLYPHAATMKMMERFAREIMPAFAPELSASASGR
ncbi:MAG: LLM class flavin-dependent oxidoreductase [Chloroflexi bacterium]|nr:LLM class flavin-dependent oxidoreductase [Chloroflexota bacterium]